MINLYSTNCPKCNVLKKKLDAENIEYNLLTDDESIQKLRSMGYMSAPMLEIDDKFYTFEEAVELINEGEL